MGEELGILLSSGSVLVMLMAPSMLIGLLTMGIAYKLLSKLGGRFLNTQDRQAAAFEKIANGVELMRSDIENTARLNADIRITLAAMATQINQILKNTNMRSE